MNNINRYFAQCSYNTEDIVYNELKGFNVKDISKTAGGVYFNASFDEMMFVNYNIRTANRILLIVKEFRWKHEKDLYNKVKEIKWNDYFYYDKSILIYNNTDRKYIKNSKMLSLITKDAICDKFRILGGKRPDIEKDNPNIRIFVSIHKDICSILIDTSGESLDKRAYRQKALEAPIRETLAASLILSSKWDGKSPLLDFMCGSGTIPIEAALYATNTPPQINRKEFSFFYLRNFSNKDWLKIRLQSKKNIKKIKHIIYGSDINKNAIKLSIENSKRIYMFENIEFEIEDFRHLSPSYRGIIITNPPYGRRMNNEDIRKFYIELNNSLKRNFKGWDFFMIADKPNHGFLGFKANEKKRFYNGPIEVLFNKYQIRI